MGLVRGLTISEQSTEKPCVFCQSSGSFRQFQAVSGSHHEYVFSPNTLKSISFKKSQLAILKFGLFEKHT